MADILMRDLSEYFREVASKPFARGEADCCIFVADWVRMLTGIDPAGELRGYSTDQGAMLRVGRAGGFLALAEAAMTRAGMKRVQEAARGDVGVVRLGNCLTAAIRGDAAWAIKETDGLIFSTAAMPLAIWRA